MRVIKIHPLPVFLFGLILLVSSCTARLTPGYDQALFNRLTDTNVKIMVLFSILSTGTNKDSCEQRQPLYNDIIGSVDALVIQAKARPMPDTAVVEEVNNLLDKRGVIVATADSVPSVSALQHISTQLTKMKLIDCKAGIKPDVLAVFRNAVVISMDQAITYESFLNR